MFYTYDLTPTLKADLHDRGAAATVWDEIHAVATLQGIVNRSAPRLCLRYVECEGRNVDDWWLARLSEPGAWLADVERESIATLEDLVGHFRDDLRGAVVYDSRVPATSNLASTLAGVEDLVAIRYDPTPGSVYDRLIERGPRLPVVRRLLRDDGAPLFTGCDALPDGTPTTGSAKCDAYVWAMHELIGTGRCDPRYLGYYIDSFWIDRATASVPNHHTLTNHDYFVARRAFFVDLHCWGDETPCDDPNQPLGTDRQTLETILAALHRRAGDGFIHVGGFTPWAYKYTSHPGAGGRHHGVLTEWELIRLVSANHAFVDADAIGYGAMANASFFAHFPLRDAYPQPRPAPHAAEHAGDQRPRIMFYVGDYDSAAWLYQNLPSFIDDPGRAAAPLSWAISPVLARRAPMALHELRTTAHACEAFIGGNNGAGYLNPTMLIEDQANPSESSPLAAWTQHCQAHAQHWDLTITGFLIDGLAPPASDAVLAAYARTTPDGVVSQRLGAPARLLNNTPILRAGPDVGDDDPTAAARRIADYVRARQSGTPLPADEEAAAAAPDPEEHLLEDHRAAVDPAARDLPCFWFRTVLKSPSWHAAVVATLREIAPEIEVVTAPVLFARLREHLAQ